jgi:arylsulfatase A-like enzyme
VPHNIVFLMTDQHRRDTLGCYGNAVCKTPHLDGLADEGVRFDNCFTPTAICTPARATLVTGVLPFRHRLLANYERNVGYLEELPHECVLFSRLLRQAGYNVGLEGKWHLSPRRGPAEYGFDGPFYPGWHNPVDHPLYRSYLAEHGLPEPVFDHPIRALFPNGQPGNLLAGVLRQPVEATFEYFLAQRTIERLRQYAAEYDATRRPFFMACHWFGPHLPYLVPPSYFERYDPALVTLPASIAERFDRKPPVQKRYAEHWGFDTLTSDVWRQLIAAYWGYVSLIDEQVGRILSAVQTLGLWDSTAAVFVPDHGEFTGSHRLNDKGPAMYDDIYRIPCILRLPDGIKAAVEERFVTLGDLMPTILDFAGVPAPPGLDGRSLLPLLEGNPPANWRQEVTAEFHGHHFPYPQRMIRTRRYKLVVNPESINELYDLEHDPSELFNRYGDPSVADVQGALLERLYLLLKERGDNFYHWMTGMYPVGGKTYDEALSPFE